MAIPPTEISRFDLPGLNLPLNWTPHAAYTYHKCDDSEVIEYIKVPAQGEGLDLFPVALNDADVSGGYTSLYLTTLREFTMLHIMNALTDKPGWEEKVFDDSIVEKWKMEAMTTPGRDVSQKMADWVIKELRWKAEIFKKTGAVMVYNGDVIKSDTAIPDSIKEALQEQARKLEAIPEVYKDYHPGSNGKVLDLVHPSLFPLIYGTSRVLKDRLIGLEDCIKSCGKGDVVPVRDEEETKLDQKAKDPYSLEWNQPPPPYGKNFQWLPCEVDITSGNAKITSYINNLHPEKNKELYAIVESVIIKTIPLWNMTLTVLRHHDSTSWRIKYELEYDIDPEEMADEDKPQQEEGEGEYAFWDRYEAWATDTRKVKLPEPEPEQFEPKEIPAEVVNLVKDYAHRGLQIIVKLANIELTPENPEYEGGTWHVEGQLNEHICATALYYYDNENIMPSQLAFRQQSSTDEASNMNYLQGVHEWLQEIYGCENGDAAVQDVGPVTCSEGRLVTFPNVLQHQVQPFSLRDPAKPGHRKILALFLVDPGIRIISTANVPPQQRDWWGEEVDRQIAGSGKALAKLSAEMKDKIFQGVDDFPISMETAKELRLKLMEERKTYVTTLNRTFRRNDFSLCEH
ncbi:hypothetical protein BKA65DRAFT_458937 [Rhexocercosporidium sp. MPI-PUGE-AT-0058]|nr:hypothetical protein BKA65DRAFT_458937 [Rhexocercosporidium sp. MPI-PUGE-AT-0058]